MVLFPAPAGPSMAMISLGACGGWVGCWFIVAARLYTGRGGQESNSTRQLLRCTGRGGHRDNLRRSDLQHRSSRDVHEAQLAGGQQRVDRLFHLRAGDELSEERLEFRLLD